MLFLHVLVAFTDCKLSGEKLYLSSALLQDYATKYKNKNENAVNIYVRDIRSMSTLYWSLSVSMYMISCSKDLCEITKHSSGENIKWCHIRNCSSEAVSEIPKPGLPPGGTPQTPAHRRWHKPAAGWHKTYSATCVPLNRWDEDNTLQHPQQPFMTAFSTTYPCPTGHPRRGDRKRNLLQNFGVRQYVSSPLQFHLLSWWYWPEVPIKHKD